MNRPIPEVRLMAGSGVPSDAAAVRRARAGVGRRHGAWIGMAAGLLLGFGLAAQPARAALVQVAVYGVAQARGHVRVELCTRDTFLTNACPYQGEAPATVGWTVVTIAAVPPGEYAAQAFHDVTDQGVVHQNILGIPRERIGFSNDAPLRARGPRFSDAAFYVGREAQYVTLRLRRLFHIGD